MPSDQTRTAIMQGCASPAMIEHAFDGYLTGLAEASRQERPRVVDGLILCIRATQDYETITGVPIANSADGVEAITHIF